MSADWFMWGDIPITKRYLFKNLRATRHGMISLPTEVGRPQPDHALLLHIAHLTYFGTTPSRCASKRFSFFLFSLFLVFERQSCLFFCYLVKMFWEEASCMKVLNRYLTASAFSRTITITEYVYHLQNGKIGYI